MYSLPGLKPVTLMLVCTNAVLGLVPASLADNAIHERDSSSSRNVCGSERGESGLLTNYYCEGSNPVCCRDSTTTIEDGIPWACIPADGLCCGQGDYCSGESYCIRERTGYSCRSSGLDLPSLVGSTPELEFDHSDVGGDDNGGDDDDGSALRSSPSASMAWVLVLGFSQVFLF